MFALRRLAQTLLNDRKGEASCLGTSELLLVVGDLHIVVGTSGGTPAPGLQRLIAATESRKQR